MCALARSPQRDMKSTQPRQATRITLINPHPSTQPKRNHLQSKQNGARRQETLPQSDSQEDHQGALGPKHQEERRCRGMPNPDASSTCGHIIRMLTLLDLLELRALHGNVSLFRLIFLSF